MTHHPSQPPAAYDFSRNPTANRGVIAFAAWLNIAHAAVMTVMAVHLPNEREDMLIASAIFAGIGAILILLPPPQQLSERTVRNP